LLGFAQVFSREGFGFSRPYRLPGTDRHPRHQQKRDRDQRAKAYPMTSNPFGGAFECRGRARANRLVGAPTVQIRRQCIGGEIATGRIFFQALDTSILQ
jgi:hypothetical protein